MRRRRSDPHDDPPPRGRRYDPPGPVPTLSDLMRRADWVWVNCARTGCWHRKPMKLAPLIERFGADASSDVIRKRARCDECGHIGATITTPSSDGRMGIVPFPGEKKKGPDRSNSGGWGSGHASYD